ncbi:MAG: hypothetical protein L7F77_16595, partial [Candidatus Magnetominusculus sp. LBB02]|nr:hypothetical protein [Candidatus Magnetominusculus sp. LBB02]
LMVGDLEIESTQYEEYRYDSDYLNWIPGAVPGMTLVSHSGDAHGGYGDGAISASGSISGPNKFNAELKVETFLNTSTGRDNVRWWPVSIGERHVGRRTGYRDIHVTAFDNMDGANCFIIMYKKSYVYFTDSVDVPNVNDGTTPVPVTEQIEKPTVATHHIAYKTKGGTLVKADLTGDIRAASCQINNGFMAYTYALWEDNKFAQRIIGIINMTTGAKKEWQRQDDDDELKDFKHFNMAAIGIL